MGIKYTDGSNEYLLISQNLIGTDVFTWMCWFFLESQTGFDQTFMMSGDGDVGQDDGYHRLQYDDSINDIRFSFRNGPTEHAITTSGANIGGWNHCLAFRASATDAQCFLNGDAGGSNSTSVTGVDARTNFFSVGMSRDDTPGDPCDGILAEIAIWNIALSDDADRQALAAGMSPLLVRPDALIRYFPCVNLADLNDRLSSTTLTAFNTPISGDHPKIFRPSSQLILPINAPVPPPPPLYRRRHIGFVHG